MGALSPYRTSVKIRHPQLSPQFSVGIYCLWTVHGVRSITNQSIGGVRWTVVLGMHGIGHVIDGRGIRYSTSCPRRWLCVKYVGIRDDY